MVDLTDREELQVIKKELIGMSYQMTALFDRWLIEQQHVGKREAEMSRVIERMEEKIKEFASNSKQIKQALTDSASTVVTAIDGMRTKISAVILTSTTEAATMIGSNAVEGALGSGQQKLKVMQQKLVNSTQDAYENIEKVAAKYQEMAHKSKLSTWSAALIVAIGVSCVLGYYVNWRIGQTMEETLTRKFGQMFDTIDSYAKVIEKSTLEKVNKNVRK